MKGFSQSKHSKNAKKMGNAFNSEQVAQNKSIGYRFYFKSNERLQKKLKFDSYNADEVLILRNV